jgi:hypothetical protein
MQNSCGALFYTHDPNGVMGIILGEEGRSEWLPFKGCNNNDETYEAAAIREIKEETCGIVHLDEIVLEHVFSSKRKNYFIGLCYVPYTTIKQFDEKIKTETREEFCEKKRLKFFALSEVMQSSYVHNISKASIGYYWNRLTSLQKNVQPINHSLMRYHGVTHDYAYDEYCKLCKDVSDTYYNHSKEQKKLNTTSHIQSKLSTDTVCDTAYDIFDILFGNKSNKSAKNNNYIKDDNSGRNNRYTRDSVKNTDLYNVFVSDTKLLPSRFDNTKITSEFFKRIRNTSDNSRSRLDNKRNLDERVSWRSNITVE